MKKSSFVISLLTMISIIVLVYGRGGASTNMQIEHLQAEKSRLERELQALRVKIGIGEGNPEVREQVSDITYRLQQIEKKERRLSS